MLHNRFLLLDYRAKRIEQGLKEPCFYVILTIIMLKNTGFEAARRRK